MSREIVSIGLIQERFNYTPTRIPMPFWDIIISVYTPFAHSTVMAKNCESVLYN